MATIYSGTDSDLGSRSYITYTVTQTETTWSITASFGIQAYTKAINIGSGNFDFPLTGSLSSDDYGSMSGRGLFTDGNSRTYNKKPFSLAKGSSKKLLGDYTKTIAKETFSQNFNAHWSTGQLVPYGSSKDLDLTIPALKSYTVSYNANGGTGAPSSQTKYYGKTITLSSTVPTRTGYTFEGWATTADGVAVYQPSGAYTANSGATLYAVWKWRYDPATITNLVATRYVLVDDVYVESDTGDVARVRFNWTKSVDGTTVLQPSAIKVGIKLTTASSYTWATVQNITDNYIDGFYTNVNLSADNAYDVRVKIEHTEQPDVTADTYISESFFVWDVNADGTAISFGKSAKDDETGYRFADDIMTDGNMEASGDITAGGEITDGEGYSIPHAEEGTTSISTTTGTLNSHVIARYGRVRMLRLSVHNSATAAGSNLYQGKINTEADRPIFSSAYGSGYCGSAGVMVAIEQGGTITVRVVGAKIAANGSTWCGVTYIAQGD